MQESVSLASFAAAFGAGLVSVLSPCVLPLMPAYLSLLSGVSVEALQDSAERAALRARVVRGCLGFIAGFSLVFVLLGATATRLGRVLRGFEIELFGAHVSLAQLAGVLIVAMGLHLLGALPIRWLYRDARIGTRFVPKSAFGTFLVGAAFAFGWIPCVGPILGGILTLAASHETLGAGVGLLGVYALGLAVPFAAAALSLDWYFETFAHVKRYFRRIERVSGALLVALGLLVVTDRLTIFNTHLAFLNRWVQSLEALFR
jgi:cytochrome c-type biogenesis protein